MKVYLDAGHGGFDSGAVGIGGRLEKDDSQKLTDILRKSLEKCGFQVVVNTNVNQTLEEVVKQANGENVDLFVSLHRNAFYDPNANGLEIWTCDNPSQRTKNNAQIVYNKIISLSQSFRGRGLKEDNFYVLYYTKAPAMLIELGFITNSNDNYLFDNNLNEYAKCICQGICEIFNVHYVEDEEKRYIRLGGYTKIEADYILTELHKKGFTDARII